MSVKVKICGIRNLDNALAAIDAGVDFLGFNFVPTSKNYINPERAKEIIDFIRHSGESRFYRDDSRIKRGKDSGKIRMTIVGVFQNERIGRLLEITEKLGLDLVQLHGNEHTKYCEGIKKPVIKAFMISSDFEVESVKEEMDKIKVQYYLIDREKRGEGEVLNFSKAKTLASNYPLFLSGGLNIENIAEAVSIVRPFAVDVSSGVETNGVKDNEKIRQFIQRVKEAQI